MQVKRTHYGWKMFVATAYAHTHTLDAMSLSFVCSLFMYINVSALHASTKWKMGEKNVNSVENVGIYDNPFRIDVVVGLERNMIR